MTVERHDVLRFRLSQHQLDREPGSAAGPTDTAMLDFGVQDTGPDGAAWALAIRGLPSFDPQELAFAWTLRGAPHAYRRADLAAVALATAPLCGADAARTELWPVIGRPGAIVADGEVIGTWRPRTSGRRFTLRIQPWGPLKAGYRALIEEQAARLAAHDGRWSREPTKRAQTEMSSRCLPAARARSCRSVGSEVKTSSPSSASRTTAASMTSARDARPRSTPACRPRLTSMG